MNSYDLLLVELMKRLDEKADKLIALLEINQSAEDKKKGTGNGTGR